MRILGLDIGSSRIGTAVSDPGKTTALPLEIVDAHDATKAIKRVSELIDEYDAEAVVYGLPLTLAGERGPQSDIVAAFINELKKATDVPLIAIDERLSTKEAEKMLIAQDIKRNKRKLIIDMVAASIILQSYLDGENE